MPLPTPRKNEKESAFISRCISYIFKHDSDLDPKSKKDRKQATAMAYDQWRDEETLIKIFGSDATRILLRYANGAKRFTEASARVAIESFQWALPIIDSYNEDEGHWIKGVALTVGKSRNLTKYDRQELMTAANTLMGKPLLVNHDPDKAVGNVHATSFEDEQIEYIAQVTDESYWKKILNGTISHVSPLGHPLWWELTEKDKLLRVSTGARAGTPRRIVFDELSLVEPPEQAGVLDTSIIAMESMKVMEMVGDVIMGTKFRGRIKVE